MSSSVIHHTKFDEQVCRFKIGDLVNHIMDREALGIVLEASYQPRNMTSWWNKELIEIVEVYWFSGATQKHHYFNLEKVEG